MPIFYPLQRLLLINKSLASLPYKHLFKKPVRYFSDHSTSNSQEVICKKKIETQVMTKDDLALVMDWAKNEKWNPGLYEVDALYAADPKGYHLLKVDDKPVASLAAVRYKQDLVFLGLYIVPPPHRGQGYGKLLWDMVMRNIKSSSTIGLNGVKEQIANYQKEEFKLTYPNVRWNGELSTSKKSSFINSPKNFSLYKPTSTSLTPLLEYDARFFLAPRPEFLSKWLTMPESHTLVAVKNGEICGYGVISRTVNGYKIAPLVADNTMIAEEIYTALCRCIGKQDNIQIDTPTNNLEATRLMQYFGLKKEFETFRMYRGEIIPSKDEKWFGLTSLEIG